MSSGFQLARRQAEAYEIHTGVFMDGSARLLANGASIGAGDAVLDLACGTGLVARHAAALVTPGGRVVGADINPAMLAIAHERSSTPIDWVEAPCDALPFGDESFTHVICQQGVQFFPDPVAAFAEARRVLQPGGVLVATVWATPGHNPYIEAQLDLLAKVDGSVVESVQRATPPMADLFLSTTADAAGYGEIGVSMLEHTVTVPDLATWFVAQTSGTPWGPTIVALDAADRERLVADLLRRLAPFATANGHELAFGSHRLVARRPSA